jgi:hypothetical protein
MSTVPIQIVRMVHENNPDFVAAELRDAFGNVHTFVDKVPIFCEEYCLPRDASYPVPGVLGCEVVERWVADDGKDLARIDTEIPWHIESTLGEHYFVVLAEKVNSDTYWQSPNKA